MDSFVCWLRRLFDRPCAHEAVVVILTAGKPVLKRKETKP